MRPMSLHVGLFTIAIFAACVTQALAVKLGSMSTNYVNDACGYTPGDTSLDQSYAQIKLVFNDAPAAGYSVGTLTFSPSTGPACMHQSGEGGWSTSGNDLIGSAAKSPVEVSYYHFEKEKKIL